MQPDPRRVAGAQTGLLVGRKRALRRDVRPLAGNAEHGDAGAGPG